MVINVMYSRSVALKTNLGVLAKLKVAPAGFVDDRVGTPVRVHVHGADGGGEHDTPDAGVGGRIYHVLGPLHRRCHHLLLRHTTLYTPTVPFY